MVLPTEVSVAISDRVGVYCHALDDNVRNWPLLLAHWHLLHRVQDIQPIDYLQKTR